MVESTDVPLARLSWSAERLAPELRDGLVGAGAPLELVTEDVLGAPTTVFARRPRSLRELLDTRTADFGEFTYLAAPSREWTYREARADIDALAVLLERRYGIRAGDRVAIASANSAEYALLLWAVVTIGAIATGLNGWWTTAELDHGIELTAPKLIAGDERRLARLSGHQSVRLDELYAQSREFAGQRPEPPAITEDSPAIILFTSGTTGQAKGATLAHRNIINFAMVTELAAASTGVRRPPGATILTSPMFHVSGLVSVFMTGVVLHTRLVFPPPGSWDAARYLRLTEQHGVTSWSGVPTQFWRLLRHPDIATRDVSSVINVGAGGAVYPPELVRELHAKLPNARLGNGYGMSESVGLGTLTGGELFITCPESVGPAEATVELEIRDEQGRVLGENEVGEIYLRSPSIFLGYWNDPLATAAVLGPDRWYRTGDFGRVTGGLLYLESRRRDMILRGGENIYPIEIENRLVAHPAIDDAAVIGVEHPELGQEVKAFVVRSADSALTAGEVREWCAAALAGFKVPTHVEFRPELPYTRTGKVMKHELEQEDRLNSAAGRGLAHRSR